MICTYCTVLHNENHLYSYLNRFVIDYSEAYRCCWQYWTNEKYASNWSSQSKYVTFLCRKFDFLKRTVNSIANDVKGRLQALKELQKEQQCELKEKINGLSKEIKRLEKKRNTLRKKAAANSASQEELQAYRNLKARLTSLKNKKETCAQKHRQRQQNMKSKEFEIGWGGRKTFKAQHELESNGFRTHEEWKQSYVRQRDKFIFYLGSKDEACGNQCVQLSVKSFALDKPGSQLESADVVFSLKIRKEKRYSTGSRNAPENYIVIPEIRFKYGGLEILKALQNGQAISHRFLRRGERWYLHVSIDAYENVPSCTNTSDGVYGIDFNSGFIELIRTDTAGNLVSGETIHLRCHGKGDVGETEMAQVTAKIAEAAQNSGCSIIVEALDFRKKKANTVSGSSNSYNLMLHNLDYARFEECLERACAKRGVDLIKVDPAYTSMIGRAKYADTRKLSMHRAAAYVIGRRGQGFFDRLDD